MWACTCFAITVGWKCTPHTLQMSLLVYRPSPLHVTKLRARDGAIARRLVWNDSNIFKITFFEMSSITIEPYATRSFSNIARASCVRLLLILSFWTASVCRTGTTLFFDRSRLRLFRLIDLYTDVTWLVSCNEISSETLFTRKRRLTTIGSIRKVEGTDVGYNISTIYTITWFIFIA